MYRIDLAGGLVSRIVQLGELVVEKKRDVQLRHTSGEATIG